MVLCGVVVLKLWTIFIFWEKKCVCVVCSGVSQTAFKGCIKDVQLGTLAKDLSENIEFKDVSPGCTEVQTQHTCHHCHTHHHSSDIDNSYVTTSQYRTCSVLPSLNYRACANCMHRQSHYLYLEIKFWNKSFQCERGLTVVHVFGLRARRSLMLSNDSYETHLKKYLYTCTTVKPLSHWKFLF